jgi:hypothetical protein
MSAHNIVRPINVSCWLTTCGGKKVNWHINNREANINNVPIKEGQSKIKYIQKKKFSL